MLVRFIAAALIGWALIELTLYWAVCRHNQQPAQLVPCLVRLLPLFLGLIALIKAKSLAAWLSDKLDL